MFQEFQHYEMKYEYMGSGSKAAVVLNWADLSSLLSIHCICAEYFLSPHCIEDCLGPWSSLPAAEY
jgi:hypothetical protein